MNTVAEGFSTLNVEANHRNLDAMLEALDLPVLFVKVDGFESS